MKTGRSTARKVRAQMKLKHETYFVAVAEVPVECIELDDDEESEAGEPLPKKAKVEEEEVAEVIFLYPLIDLTLNFR